MDVNTAKETHTSFLGTGWSFPPEFVHESGEVLMTSDEEDIQNSLKILLGTVLGERIFNPNYGLDLHEMLFEPISTTTTTFLKDRVRTAILFYEPRIDLLSLEFDTTEQPEGKVNVRLDFEIQATNSRFNLVYPFYLTDSNEVRGGLPPGAS